MFAWEMVFPLTLAEVRATGIGFALWGLALLLGVAAAIVIAVLWVSAWYARHYGVVKRTSRQNWLATLLVVIGVAAFLIPFEIDALSVPSARTIPVNLADFTIGGWIVVYWLYIGREFSHYLVFAAVGVVLGFISLAGMPPATYQWHLREITLYFGAVCIAAGLIDHRILTRALSPPTEAIGGGS